MSFAERINYSAGNQESGWAFVALKETKASSAPQRGRPTNRGLSEPALMQARRRVRASSTSPETTCLATLHEQSGEGAVSALVTHRRRNSSSPRQSDDANGAQQRRIVHASYPRQSERTRKKSELAATDRSTRSSVPVRTAQPG